MTVREADLQNHITTNLFPNNGYTCNPNIKNPKTLKNNLLTRLNQLNQQHNPRFTPLTPQDLEEIIHALHLNNTPHQAQEKALHNTSIFFTRHNGTLTDLLLHHPNPYKNTWEVATEYTTVGAQNRVDVLLLRNGLPVAIGELKNHDVPLIKAYKQVRRYREEGLIQDKLLSLAPIFFLSNGANTRYLPTLNNPHLEGLEDTEAYKLEANYWGKNNSETITSIEEFTNLFFNPENFTDYLKNSTLYAENKVVIMRYYQTYGRRAITQQVDRFDNNASQLNPHSPRNLEAGGYLSHSTGSGKTFTLLTTARALHRANPEANILVLTDRVELGQQMSESFKTWMGSEYSEPANSHALKSEIQAGYGKVILSSHQTVNASLALTGENEKLTTRRTIVLYDEGHRSQAGQMTKNLRKKLKKAQFFAVTGTPVTALNPLGGQTTDSIFGDMLHFYGISHAVRDANTVPFRLFECSALSLNRENTLEAFEQAQISLNDKYRPTIDSRLTQEGVVDFIGENYRDYQQVSEGDEETCMVGILATRSIAEAVSYARIFQEKNSPVEAFVYASPSDLGEAEEFIRGDYERLCALFGLSPRNNGWRAHYYRELRKAAENASIDLLIAVRVFLTGYDNPRVNTLWLDKPLNNRELVQAMSRTNRPFPGKTEGNIVSFAPIRGQVESALGEFGGEVEGPVVSEPISLQEVLHGSARIEGGLVQLAEDIRGFSVWFGRDPHAEGVGANELRRMKDVLGAYSRILRKASLVPGFSDGMGGSLSAEEWLQAEGLLHVLREVLSSSGRVQAPRRDMSHLFDGGVRLLSEGVVSSSVGVASAEEESVRRVRVGRSVQSAVGEESFVFCDGEELNSLVRFLTSSLDSSASDVQVALFWYQQVEEFAQNLADSLGVRYDFLVREMRGLFRNPDSPSLEMVWGADCPSAWVCNSLGAPVSGAGWEVIRGAMRASARAGECFGS